MYSSGPLLENNLDGFTQYYRSKLVLKDNKHNQRTTFEAKMADYINIGVEKLKEKNLIPENIYVKFVKK
jgi:hypothetical protein